MSLSPFLPTFNPQNSENSRQFNCLMHTKTNWVTESVEVGQVQKRAGD